MEALFIVKIGGNVIDDAVAFRSFLKDFAMITSPKILVHGGGKIATQIGDQLRIESKYTDGRRITDDETIDLVIMVYGGLINKKAVALLQGFGCNAIGITGADANLIPAIKRPVKEIDFGWVGDVDAEKIPAALWSNFLNQGLAPVVAPLTHDQDGHMLNTNADTIAATLAKALAPFFETSLIYCFEKKGVLADMADEESFLPTLNKAAYDTLKQQNKLFAGILPKLQNAFDAAQGGARRVVIGHSADLNTLISGIGGTKIEN